MERIGVRLGKGAYCCSSPSERTVGESGVSGEGIGAAAGGTHLARTHPQGSS